LAFNANYEASDNVIFSIILLLFPHLRPKYLLQRFTKELFVFLYLWQTKFHTHKEQENNYFAVREILEEILQPPS